MILFPRRADKYKKDQISDSTAEKLKSAEADKQIKDSHLMAKPTVNKREKSVQITDDMKNFRAFRKIRQVMTNKYYMGKREKRAAEKAEKEKSK